MSALLPVFTQAMYARSKCALKTNYSAAPSTAAPSMAFDSSM